MKSVRNLRSRSPYRPGPLVRCTSGLVLGLALALPATAASFSVEEAVSHALENNPRLGSSEASIREAERNVAVARSAGGPRVDAAFSSHASNNPLDAFANKLQAGNIEADMAAGDLGDFDPDTLNEPDTSTLLMGEVSVSYPLYTGGRLQAGIRSAESAHRAASMGHQRSREVIAYQAHRAYLGVQVAEQALSIAEEAVAAAERHVATTRDLVRQGRIVESDQLTAEVNLSEMRAGRMEAVKQVRQARNRLRLAMGMDQDEPVEVTPLTDWDDHHAGLAERAELQEMALDQRQDLRALRAQLRAQQSQVEAIRAERKPTVSLQAAGNTFGEDSLVDNTSWRVMGVINYRLYDGGVVSSRTAASRARTAAVRAEIASREQSIRNEVRTAHDDIQVAAERLEAARGNVERARRNVTLVNTRYGQGRTILIDLLQAEGGLVKARQEALGANAALHVAGAELALAQGRILQRFGED